MTMLREWHVSRTWTGDRLERDCPCPKASCGFVIQGEADPGCEQHTLYQTMRRGHDVSNCPGPPSSSGDGDSH